MNTGAGRRKPPFPERGTVTSQRLGLETSVTSLKKAFEGSLQKVLERMDGF